MSFVSRDDASGAAEALRAAEVEAAAADDIVTDLWHVSAGTLTGDQLEAMSIDDVRAIANALEIPERSKITEKSQLIDEILRRI
jgi:hypothetical protein